MIHSMTAFARQETKGDWGNGVWEIRSVNQRYLESYFRLPETLRSLEPILREKLRKQFNRGKIEVSLRLTLTGNDAQQLNINQQLAKQLIEQASWIKNEAGEQCQAFSPVEILRWPGVLEAEETDMDLIQKTLVESFDIASKELKASRASEGETLKTLIVQRLTGIQEQVHVVRNHQPEAISQYKKKLTDRLEEIKAELDQSRLEQEMAYLAQKVDIAEELDRLESHIQETHQILNKGGACGRRLDFMMQEFNRESNTLSSKSISPEVTKSAVEMKVLVEQMREQIQNIE